MLLLITVNTYALVTNSFNVNTMAAFLFITYYKHYLSSGVKHLNIFEGSIKHIPSINQPLKGVTCKDERVYICIEI